MNFIFDAEGVDADENIYSVQHKFQADNIDDYIAKVLDFARGIGYVLPNDDAAALRKLADSREYFDRLERIV